MILILGHPRCGTNYSADLFSSILMTASTKPAIGSEVMGHYGISAWSLAANDPHPPYVHDGTTRRNRKWEFVAHCLRHPLAAIQSIRYREDTQERSLEFRKKYVTIYGEGLEQATMSYLGWNKLIQAQCPDLTFRVDSSNDIDVVIDVLDNHGYNIHAESMIKLPPRNVNTRGKLPPLSVKTLKSAIPSDLFMCLNDFAAEFGYDLFEELRT